MRNVKFTFLTAVMLAIPAAVMATEAGTAPVVSQNGNTVGELERIQSDTVLYEARASRNKALLNWKQSGGTGDAVIPAPVITGAPAPEGGARAVSALPRILEIAGGGKVLRCRLKMPDGSVVEASAGQPLPGTEFHVQQVTASTVTLISAAGKTHNLLFSGDD
jgi:type IV pilus biogenesis protein PilP